MQKGRNCIVVGGTHGIGLAITHKLFQEEAECVIICSRKESSLKSAKESLLLFENKLYTTTCNVSDSTDICKFVEFVKKTLSGKSLDVLVSNVGVDPVSGKVLDASETLFDKIFTTNVKAAWLLVKLLKPLMKENSSILLMSSTGGLQPSYPSGLYGASKTALIGLGRALASELGEEKIRINVICPGLVKTRMSESFWKGPYGEVAEKSLFLRRLGLPEDIASISCFLLSQQCSWITGQTIVVDGGSHTRL